MRRFATRLINIYNRYFRSSSMTEPWVYFPGRFKAIFFGSMAASPFPYYWKISPSPLKKDFNNIQAKKNLYLLM